MAKEGFFVGITARRTELLEEIHADFPTATIVKKMDINDPENATRQLNELIEEMDGVDIIVISSGIGFINRELNLEEELNTIKTNVAGFTAIATAAFRHFIKQKSGHLVGITSIAGIRGAASAPAYGASKSFQSNYLEALRQKATRLKLPIFISDILPGYVDTVMAQGDGIFWMSSTQVAAKQIYQSIKRKSSKAYVTRRWRIIAWALKSLPNWIYKRL
jgi:short-subunit dehydrogenase